MRMAVIASAGRLVAGRYRLERELGRGGMATVYRAQDQQLQRPVALKLVERDPLGAGGFAGAVLCEARAAAAVQHPNVVTVYDVGQCDGAPFIALELVEGGDLLDLLRARGRLEPAEAAWLGYGLSLGLAALHAHGLVHRDVKPGNILLTPEGRPKLADFGIARAAAAADSLDGQAIVGTATYLSPEQARGQSVDARADVYALGLVLYELLTGAPPFAGGSPVEVAARRLLIDPEPPRRVRPEIPVGLAAVVERALARDPAERYADASELAAALAALVVGEPLAAGRPAWAAGLARPDEPTARARPAAPTTQRLPAAPRRRSRPLRAWPTRASLGHWLALAGLLVMLLGGLALLSPAGAGEAAPEVSVPAVAALPYLEAVERLEAAGLGAERAETILTLQTPAGLVVTQRPAEGSRALSGSIVALTVSAGQVQAAGPPPISPPLLAPSAPDPPPSASGEAVRASAEPPPPAAEPPIWRPAPAPPAPEPARLAAGPAGEQGDKPEKPDQPNKPDKAEKRDDKPAKPDKPAGRGRERD
jgi:serine/threonine-protein kinase